MSLHPVRFPLALVPVLVPLLLPAAAMAQDAGAADPSQPAPGKPASSAASESAGKPAAAGKDKPAVQTVEVRGAAASYDPRRDDTASKTVINADELRKYGDDNIFDVLKRAPGVTVTGKTIRMRGLGAGYTQILVNGDRPPPGFSLDALMPDQIERIEVVRAASAEFSMQSIAGTINIVLRKLVTKPQHDLRLNLAHSSQQRNGNTSGSVNGTWAEKRGNFSYFLNGSLYGGKNEIVSQSADRFRLPSGELVQSRAQAYEGGGTYRGLGLFPRVSWKFESGDELNLSVGVQATRSGWNGAGTTVNLVGAFPAPDYIETHSGSPATQRMLRSEVNWIAKLAGGKLDLTVSHERSRNTDEDDDVFYTAGRALRLLRDWDSTVQARRASLRAKYTRSLFDGHALAAGIDTSVQENDEVRLRDEQSGAAAPTRVADTFQPRVTRFAAYAQDEWSIDKQLSLYLGARWEGVRTDSSARSAGDTTSAGSAADTVADVHARNHVLGPVLQTLYKFPGGTGRQLRVALTRTYKAPTIDQLTARRYQAPVNDRFNADASGNPDLRPELARGIDVAYEHYLAQGAMVSLSASRRDITDYIRSRLDLDPDGRWVLRPLNDGDALVRSLEAECKTPGKLLGAALAAFDLRASLTRNWSKVDAVPGPGNRLDAQTPLSGTLGVDYRKGDLSLGSSLSYQKGAWVRVSAFQSQRQFTQRNLDAYALWKFNPRYQLRLSLSNLLAQDIRQDRLYRDDAGTSRELNYQPGVRRVGLNLEMKL